MDKKYFGAIDNLIRSYYEEKICSYGATSKGVDWNSKDQQNQRFSVLMQIVKKKEEKFSINEYGCGYGALAQYLTTLNLPFTYSGFDLSQTMIDEARKYNKKLSNCGFFVGTEPNSQQDYSIASGIFNVKLDISLAQWEEYILSILHNMNQNSIKGFSVNFLTKYSDKEKIRKDLYYADPCFLFDYCKTHFSSYVSLLHDYPLYEFTLLIRKNGSI